MTHQCLALGYQKLCFSDSLKMSNLELKVKFSIPSHFKIHKIYESQQLDEEM